MRQVRRKFYKQKLAFLAQNELGITIQNDSSNSILPSSLSTQTSNIGHSSVEDATATLLIYLKHHQSWEQSLRFPLCSLSQNEKTYDSSKWNPLTLYLDGCNLPMGLRRQVRSKGTMETIQYQLMSKTTVQGTTEVFSPFDWIPAFQSSLVHTENTKNSSHPPQFQSIIIMFDGNMYRNCNEEKRPNQRYNISSNINVEITDIGVQVDDVLVEKCQLRQEFCSQNNLRKNIVSIQKVVEYLERGQISQNLESDIALAKGDHLNHYFVVRRKGGGSKIHKKLFGKLNLRRAEEGAVCLTALTNRLHKHSITIAKELERARVHGIVEYEMRERSHVSSVVVTNDILLADRLVKNGVIVLNYKQMQQLV